MKLCAIPNCPRQSHARRLCMAHYMQWRQDGFRIEAWPQSFTPTKSIPSNSPQEKGNGSIMASTQPSPPKSSKCSNHNWIVTPMLPIGSQRRFKVQCSKCDCAEYWSTKNGKTWSLMNITILSKGLKPNSKGSSEKGLGNTGSIGDPTKT